MRPRWNSYLLLAVAALLPSAAVHAQCRAASADHALAVIELYTSEGCDSCPPADRWLSGLRLGTDSAVALAFHVDYWDRLGWRDRFASAAFTQRQYEQSRRHRGEFVFTPQVLLQGRDFSWQRETQPNATIAGINARPPRAAIELAVDSADSSAIAIDVSVRVSEPRARSSAAVVVALTQDGLSSNVRAGENAGKHLNHDHVVRAWQHDLSLDAAGELRRTVRFARPEDRGGLTVVALAEDTRTGEILQALSLPVCGP